MKLRIAAILLFLSVVPVRAAVPDRLAALGTLITSGHAEEARTQLRDAAEAYRAAGDVHGEALSHFLLAFAEVELRDIDAARASLQSAAAKFEAANDAFTAATALHYVAGLDIREGKWEAAVKQEESVLAMLRKTMASDAPVSLEAVSVMGRMFGKPTAMFDLLGGLPGMKQALVQLSEMMSHDVLGGALVELGQLDRAEAELKQAGEISAQFFGLFDGALAEHVGDLRRRQGRFEEARQSYGRALDGLAVMALPTFVTEPVELKILGRLADVDLLSGRIADALAWNDRALAFVRATHEPAREASLLEDRATLLMQANRFTEALQVLDGALAIAEKINDQSLKADIVTDMGSLLMFRGNYGAAAARLENAITLCQQNKDPLCEGHAWTMLAENYLALGADDSSADQALDHVCALASQSRYPPAQALANVLVAAHALMSGKAPPLDVIRSLQPFLSSQDLQSQVRPEIVAMIVQLLQFATGSSPELSAIPGFPIGAEMTYLFEGRQRFLRGDIAGARELWTKALESGANTDFRSGYLTAIGATYWKEGNAAEAKRWFKQAADLIDDSVGTIADDELLARYLGSGRRTYFDFAIDVLTASGNAEEAFEYAERARARAFLQTIGNHRIQPRHASTAPLVREAESRRIRIAELERRGPESELEEARKQYRAVLRRVKTADPEYASLTRIEPVPVAQLRAELPADTTLVSYFLTRDAAHAWVLDRESFQHVLLPLPQDTLRRAVCWSDRFRVSHARGAAVPLSKCDDAASAEDVFDALVAPLRDRIRNRRLIIVPHGVLHQLPFAALRDRRSGRYLIDSYTLLFAPSASSLRFLREKETPVDGGALVIGNPDGALGNLEGAQQEAVAVARELGTVAITGANATESLLYDLDGSVDLLHIGAHGTYDAANPLFSRIALAPGGGRDGNLDVDEILNELDLRGVNLVVLSACVTAAGERSGGDDVVGLTRAVLYAGSPGVISTLWNIDDDAAAVLMEELYCRLRAGALAADALHDAQLALLHNPRYSDPQFWAAFMLTGDPQGRFNVPGKR